MSSAMSFTMKHIDKLQMDNAEAVKRYKDEIAQLNKEIEELERKRDKCEWLSVGAMSYQQLSRFKPCDILLCNVFSRFCFLIDTPVCCTEILDRLS